ncbi:hypothetical protein D3C71_1975280 [compost metagenome]
MCWNTTSTPWSISALAASASLPGSNHELTHTTLISVPGLYLFRASWMALMSRITSGIGNEAT